MNADYAAIAVGAVVLATIAVGAFGLRISRTTSDFFVASRTVRPWWNAAAIGGEYLSVASFLGVAGLTFAFGPDMLWFPVGYTMGFVVLLALVAAPLRRSGAYTVPDFAESRLESGTVRRVASMVTVGIGWLYLLPQLQGAGLTLNLTTGAPTWLGGVIVVVVVVANLVAGGMRSMTFVQGFQYWLKLVAIAVPAVFLIAVWHAHGAPSAARPVPPTFARQTTVSVPAAVDIAVPKSVVVMADGSVDGHRVARLDIDLTRGTHEIGAGTKLVFPAGAKVPQVTTIPLATNRQWATSSTGGGPYPLYVIYSLMIATFLGTMGLPHVVVRFYTNPNGRAARRTTLVVLGLLGLFYVFPAIYGALGRLYAPELLLTGQTDAVVLVLPAKLIGGISGDLLAALLAGGAFAALLSTSSGLTLAVAGVLAQQTRRSRASVHGFRAATVVAAAIPLCMALLLAGLPLAEVVGLAFAVAASSFCPLIVLGIWWRRLTSTGAVAGMISGGGTALAAGMVALIDQDTAGWVRLAFTWPAAWTAPLGFLVMIVVSLATPGRVPAGIAKMMVRLHAPEELGLNAEG